MAKIDSNKRIDINQYKDPWDKEMHNFAPGEENKFMEWFLDNANIYTSIDKGFTFEQTSDKNIQRNRCFGNSQYITNRYNKTYAEGFINYPLMNSYHLILIVILYTGSTLKMKQY